MNSSTRRKQPGFSAGHAIAEFARDMMNVEACRRTTTLIVIALPELYAGSRHAERVSSAFVESYSVIAIGFLWRIPGQVSRLFRTARLEHKRLPVKGMINAVEGDP